MFIVRILAATLLFQPQVSVSPDSPAVHLTRKVDPVYPPIARAAHVSGTVKIQTEIDRTGVIKNVKVVSGPPMLQAAALDAVKKWRYAPVVIDGKPSDITTVVSVDFDLPAPHNPNDEKIAQSFFPLSDLCHKDFSSHAEAQQTATDCGKAAETAETFSDQERFIERRSAYTFASGAYLRNKQFKEALEYAQKAVDVVAQGHDDGSGSSDAYSALAQAEVASGDLAKASDDLEKAEASERAGIKELADESDFVKREYIPVLRNLLRFHAQVLRALGQTAAADDKEVQASKL